MLGIAHDSAILATDRGRISQSTNSRSRAIRGKANTERCIYLSTIRQALGCRHRAGNGAADLDKVVVRWRVRWRTARTGRRSARDRQGSEISCHSIIFQLAR